MSQPDSLWGGLNLLIRWEAVIASGGDVPAWDPGEDDADEEGDVNRGMLRDAKLRSVVVVC